VIPSDTCRHGDHSSSIHCHTTHMHACRLKKAVGARGIQRRNARATQAQRFLQARAGTQAAGVQQQQQQDAGLDLLPVSSDTRVSQAANQAGLVPHEEWVDRRIPRVIWRGSTSGYTRGWEHKVRGNEEEVKGNNRGSCVEPCISLCWSHLLAGN
jgi:hypothetical protein